MPKLVVNPNSAAAWEIPLKPGANFIGRGFANDAKLTDPSVSGSHCQVVVDDQGVVIKDLGSTNGTFINRAPVREAKLQNGQTVHLGSVEMVYVADGDSPTTHATGHSASSIPVAIPLPTATAAPAVAVRATAAPIAVAVAKPAALVPRLAVVHPVAVPPPPTATATPPVVSAHVAAPATTPGGPCKHHPKTQGRFLCPHCRHHFCELCVTSRTVGNAAKKFCRQCGAECVPVQVQIQRTSSHQSFFSRLPDAFVYPLRGGGVIMLIVGTILLAALRFVGPAKLTSLRWALQGIGWGIFFQVFFLGYLFAYMQNIIHSTAAEERELPPLPSMANFWEDVLLPCLKLLGLLAVCFAPAIALEYYVISSEDTTFAIAIIPAFVLGILYFPMAFLAVAILDSVAAANPLQVLPSILKAPLEYFVTVSLLAAVWCFQAVGDAVIPKVFPRGLTTHSMPKLFAYLGTEAFWALVCLYLLTTAMHILGLLYVSKKDKLGWLAH